MPLKPSKGREIYIFPEIIVAADDADITTPTDETQSALSGQKGLIIGTPEPDDENQSNTIVGLTGESDRRNVVDVLLPVQVIMKDATVLQRARESSPAIELSFLQPQTAAISEITVPRFVVKNQRNPGIEQGFLRDFFRWPWFNDTFTGFAGGGWHLPAGPQPAGTSLWTGYGQAPILLGDDGDPIVFAVRRLSLSGNMNLGIALNNFALFALRYDITRGRPDPSDPTGFAGVVPAFLHEAISADYTTDFNFLSSSMDNPECTALRLHGDVFVVTTDRNGNTSLPVIFIVHKYFPGSSKYAGTILPRVEQVFTSGVNAAVTYGLTSAASEKKAIVGCGALVDSIFSDEGSSQGRQTVLLVDSPDMSTFSSKSDNRIDFRSLDSFRSVTDTSQILGATKIRFTRKVVDTGERIRHGWAITRYGEIYHSEDEGSTWQRQLVVKSQSAPTQDGNLELRMSLNDFTIADDNTPGAEVLYIVGNNNTILRSNDGGKTWIVIITSDPELITFAGKFDPIIEIPTAQAGGLTLRCVASKGEGTDTPDATRIWVGGPTLYRVDFADTNNATGIGETIDLYNSFTTPATSPFFYRPTAIIRIQNKRRLPQHNSIRWVRAGSDDEDVLLVVGEPNKNYRSILAVLDSGNDLASGGPFTDNAFAEFGEVTNLSAGTRQSIMYDISNLDPNTSYVGGSNGFIGRINLSGAPAAVLVTDISLPVDKDIRSISIIKNSDTNKLSIFALTEKTLFRSRPDTSPSEGEEWLEQQLGINSDGVANVSGSGLTSTGAASYLGVLDIENIIVATGLDVLLSDISLESRAYPYLFYIGSGQWLLACSNLSSGRVEFFRSIDDGLTFQLQKNDGSRITFPIPASPHAPTETELNTIPKCVIVRQVNGDLVCLVGTRDGAPVGNVSFNDGRSWKLGNDSSVPIPIGTLQLDRPIPRVAGGSDPGIDTGEGYRSESFIKGVAACAIGDGRIFMTIPALSTTTPYSQDQSDTQSAFLALNGGKHGVWTCRELQADQEFSASTDLKEGLPVVPGKGVYVGLGNTRIVFSAPPRINDSWTMNKAWLFPARHLVIESPSVYYATEADEDYIIQVAFRRNTVAAQQISGKSSHWNLTSFALFGCNIRQAEIWVAHPDVIDPQPSGDFIAAGSRTEFYLKSDVELGESSSCEGSLLFDISKKWIPNQFAPIFRTYYLMNLDGTQHVYKIMGNTQNALMVDPGDIPLVQNRLNGFVAAGHTDYVIFGDRMCSFGDDGIRESQKVPALLGSDMEYSRLVVLRIPIQPTFDGYRRIGSAVFGRHTPLEYYAPQSPINEQRRMRSRSARWESDAPIVSQKGVTGLETVEHLNRPIQSWTLPYEQVRTWDRDMTIYALGARMHQAFALAFDSEDKLSIELVRLSSALSPSGDGPGRSGYDIELSEVI